VLVLLARAAGSPPASRRSRCPTQLQYPSESPYAHWAASFSNNSLAENASCAIALAAQRFDYFLGNKLVSKDVNSPSLYNTAGNDAKYGWTAYDCSQKFAAVCEFAADTVQCPPPFPPPLPPPSPPSPPSPPAPPTCAPTLNATFFCKSDLSK
jgi:hypothetical protein